MLAEYFARSGGFIRSGAFLPAEYVARSGGAFMLAEYFARSLFASRVLCQIGGPLC